MSSMYKIGRWEGWAPAQGVQMICKKALSIIGLPPIPHSFFQYIREIRGLRDKSLKNYQLYRPAEVLVKVAVKGIENY